MQVDSTFPRPNLNPESPEAWLTEEELGEWDACGDLGAPVSDNTGHRNFLKIVSLRRALHAAMNPRRCPSCLIAGGHTLNCERSELGRALGRVGELEKQAEALRVPLRPDLEAIQGRLKAVPTCPLFVEPAKYKHGKPSVWMNDAGDGRFVAEVNNNWGDYSGLFASAPTDITTLLAEVARLTAENTAAEVEWTRIVDERQDALDQANGRRASDLRMIADHDATREHLHDHEPPDAEYGDKWDPVPVRVRRLVERLTAERDKARNQLAAVTTERDALLRLEASVRQDVHLVESGFWINYAEDLAELDAFRAKRNEPGG